MSNLIPAQLRPLLEADVDAVLQIQTQCYGAGFVEPREVFVRRLQVAGQCSWAAVQGDEVLAYLAAYWSRPGAVTPLNGEFADYADASVLYLHDMAVSPTAAGQGLARRMVDAAKTMARQRGVMRTALVSVQGSQDYWRRKGYALHASLSDTDAAAVRGYGADAVYMVQPYRSQGG